MKNTLFRLDPFYYILRYLIFKSFFNTALKKDEMFFVNDNIKKHRIIYWITVLMIVLMIPGIFNLEENVRIGILTGLLGPVMVLGSAWFQISFGGIPVKFLF